MFGNKETKEDKEQKFMKKWGLDGLTDPRDIASVKEIAIELAGTGLMETGMKISMANSIDQLKVSYLRTIMEQNFIIIRQLDKIASK